MISNQDNQNNHSLFIKLKNGCRCQNSKIIKRKIMLGRVFSLLPFFDDISCMKSFWVTVLEVQKDPFDFRRTVKTESFNF